MEFSKDGSKKLLDKFADDGAAYQPMILQGGVRLFCGQVSQCYCQFSVQLPLAVVYAFFDEVKKAGDSLTKFWYPGVLVCMRLARRLL